MMRKKDRLMMIFLMILTFLMPLSANEKEEIPKLIVRGESSIYKPADQFHLIVGVVSQGQNAEQALKENREKMQVVISALQKVGLEEGDYQTGQFSIEPTYSRPPKNPPSDWRALIIGYEVSNKVTIKTQKLNLAGDIIDAANVAGANSIDSISFSLKDATMYRSEAMTAAARQGMEDAQNLARVANVELVRFLEISLDNAYQSPRAVPRFMAMAAENAPTPIAPGEIEIKATVNLIYEIKSH